MFDLEARIRQWRAALSDALGERGDVLDELESHLREEFARLTLAGKPGEEAWSAALAKLGTPEQLATEFGKLPVRPLRWAPGLVILALYGFIAMGFIMPLMALAREGRMSDLVVVHVSTVVAGYLATFAFGALAIWATLQRRWGRWTPRRAECLRWWGWRFSLVALIFCIVGVALGAVWARENLGAYWTNDPRELGGVALIVWNAAALVILGQRTKPIWADLVLGLGGNVAVAFGWFFAAALAQRHEVHGYGPAPVKAFLVGFLFAHLVLFGLVLIPLRRKDTMRPERAP
jgi:hypothetical protein